MKILILNLLLIFLIFGFLLPQQVKAQDTSCNNRFVTLVNPVRGRGLWIDKTINPLKNQYELAKQYSIPVTWLLQYDVLEDEKLLSEIKSFNSAQELGVFLEVSQSLAQQARVIYPYAVPWFSPQAVFLSGYSQSERRRLIDKLFTEFKSKFSFYPKSIGAWWIDSYSLNYMKEKYNIKSTMIVADQKTTDNYGIWGQWWGVPYYPAKVNILTPASSLENKQDIVVLQWAQRDPQLAIGKGTKFSNYSLQANDYTERGKDTLYFKQLVDVYLDCKNPIGQITVGLETGIESVDNIKEYKNQLITLYNIGNLQFVTMSRMSEKFAKVYQDFPQKAEVKLGDSVWEMTTASRVNEKLNERIKYQPAISFSDYFVADKAEFLARNLQNDKPQENVLWFPWFLIVAGGLLIVSYRKKMIKIWLISILFSLAAFGLILRSYYQFGWRIYFGPQFQYLELIQVLVILISYGVVWFLNKQNRLRVSLCNLWMLPLIFGIDFLIQLIRVSFISGKYYVGVALDALRFAGVSIKPFSEINLIDQDFPSYISAAFLRVNFEYFWESPLKSLFFYPLAHILLALSVGILIIKLPLRFQKIVLVILTVLFLFQVSSIFSADPYRINPILLQ